MRRRGFTLIEVLVSSILTATIVASLSLAFAVSVRHQQNFTIPRANFERVAFFEDRVRKLVEKAIVSDTQPQSTFFVGDSISGDSSVSDRLSFTTLGARVAGNTTQSEEQDFAARNQAFGPAGGTTELSISMTPVGDPGGLSGLFLRHQTPSDTNAESGGFESVMDEDVTSFEFEFWDSTAWVATWDSRTEGRLPQAVRVRYTLGSDPDVEHVFVIHLPNAPTQVTTTDEGGTN